MRHFHMLAFLLLFFVAITYANADELSKQKKLTELVGMWNLSDVLKGYHDRCVEGYNVGSPVNIIKTDSNFFYGIKPGSIYWDNVMANWNEYVETSCTYMNVNEYQNKLIQFMYPRLSEPDIDEIIIFYRSKVGKKYINAQTLTDIDLEKYYGHMGSSAAKRAYDKYIAGLNRLYDAHSREERKKSSELKWYFCDWFCN